MIDEGPAHQSPSANDQARETGSGNNQTAGDEAAKSHIDAPEEKHRSAQRNNWRIQNGLTAFGVIFAFIAAAGGAFSAYEASKAVVASQEGATQARRAADEAHNEVVEAHGQYEQAKRQADYAGEQLDLAKAAAEGMTVPHLSGSFEDEPGLNLQVGQKLAVKFLIRNAGPGIAYNVSGRSRTAILRSDITTDEDLPKIEGAESHPIGITVLPSTTSDRSLVEQTAPLSQDDIDQTCATCAKHIYAFGTFHYADEKGTFYDSNFCGFVGETAGKRVMYYCAIHNTVAQRTP